MPLYTGSVRRWCFTVFNDLDPWSELPPGANYLVWQKEKCPKSGRLHLQCYIEMEKKVRAAAVIKGIKRKDLHIEPQGMYCKDGGWFEMSPKPSRDDAREYCMKKESCVEGPFELGVWLESEERDQGGSNLVRAVLHARQHGLMSLMDMDEFIGVRVTMWKQIESDYLRYLGRIGKQTRKVKVYCIVGVPGSGKTTRARQCFQDGTYWVTPVPRKEEKDVCEAPWFDGYRCEPNIILDELRPKCIPYRWLLRFLDEHPFDVEIKGAFPVTLCATTIIITSNDHPKDWFDWTKEGKDAYEALMRRINMGVIMWNGYPGFVPRPRGGERGNTGNSVSDPLPKVPPV